jgi:hypothetical protein
VRRQKAIPETELAVLVLKAELDTIKFLLGRRVYKEAEDVGKVVAHQPGHNLESECEFLCEKLLHVICPLVDDQKLRLQAVLIPDVEHSAAGYSDAAAYALEPLDVLVFHLSKRSLEVDVDCSWASGNEDSRKSIFKSDRSTPQKTPLPGAVLA